MSLQDTGKNRTNIKDQFYTAEHIATLCIQIILSVVENPEEYTWIEPSAGEGAFLNAIPKSYNIIGLDIDPKSDSILYADYLTWVPPKADKIIVFGNPPFGRQSSLARAFIKKSCQFADSIAFILPRSFTKPSMYNVFNSKFHCIKTLELEENSFIANGNPYNVPCIFQVWQRKPFDRPITEKINPVGFQYVTINDNYNIALRRVGALAGKCYKNTGESRSSQSHYFIKIESSMIDVIVEKLNKHTFPSNTVGPRSLSKTEVNSVLNRFILELTSS